MLSQVMHAQLQANLANADFEIAGSPIELNIDEVYDCHYHADQPPVFAEGC